VEAALPWPCRCGAGVRSAEERVRAHAASHSRPGARTPPCESDAPDTTRPSPESRTPSRLSRITSPYASTPPNSVAVYLPLGTQRAVPASRVSRCALRHLPCLASKLSISAITAFMTTPKVFHISATCRFAGDSKGPRSVVESSLPRPRGREARSPCLASRCTQVQILPGALLLAVSTSCLRVKRDRPHPFRWHWRGFEPRMNP
jgi:hypothetical protein